uniref:Cystatin domain-containing protein n=1 Tax=Strongyloides venezuelensis TaxID=75913 RepID=A0A0K0F555_STRVS
MKYLVFSIILSTVFVLTIKGDDIPDKIKWEKYTGDKSLPTVIAKNATEKYNGMKNETFDFVKLLGIKQATIKNETQLGIRFLVKKCRKSTTEEKNDEKITKSRKHVCIPKIIYAKYSNGTSGENLTVRDLDFRKNNTKLKQDNKHFENIKKDEKKTLKRSKHLLKVKEEKSKDSITTTAKVESN